MKVLVRRINHVYKIQINQLAFTMYIGDDANIEVCGKWCSVVDDILERAGDDFTIVYMDFVSDVKNLEKCFNHSSAQNVKSYTGKGMSAADKVDVSKCFRYPDIDYSATILLLGFR